MVVCITVVMAEVGRVETRVDADLKVNKVHAYGRFEGKKVKHTSVIIH